MMEAAAASPHLSAVSFVANFNDLETLILQHPAACDMYKQHLASTCIDGRKAHHIDFFLAITHLEEQEWLLVQRPKRSRATEEKFQRELMGVFEKYLLVGSACVLDISEECLESVRENLQEHINVKAFHPAIRVVVRDLAFVHFESFIQSPKFKDYKVSHASIIPDQHMPKEKESVPKVSHFFVQKALRDKSEWRRKSLDDQPGHVKEYKLHRKFGVRLGVEKTSLLEDTDVVDGEEQSADISLVSRRDRRLHVFFGDYFDIDDILFSERVQGQDNVTGLQEYQKQPTHVNTYRLARFFGTAPPTKNEQGEYEASLSRHSKTAHLNRFFGERIDPQKEATSVSFAAQPINVKSYKLKKFFGESAAHTISFGGTWPRSRAKLEKIFGPFDG